MDTYLSSVTVQAPVNVAVGEELELTLTQRTNTVFSHSLYARDVLRSKVGPEIR